MQVGVVKHLLRSTLLSALAVAGCRASIEAQPKLCDLAQNREAYADQTVSVEGILLVSHHGSVVIDPACGDGIGISWSKDDAQRMQEFSAIARRSMAETMMARVRVSGLVKREARPGQYDKRVLYLDLTNADVLEAYPISAGDKDRFRKWRSGPTQEPFRPSR